MERDLAADLVISWDGEPIFAEQLDARRDFWVGHASSDRKVDFEVAEGTLCRSFPLIVGRRCPEHVTLSVPDEVVMSGEGIERDGPCLRLPLGARADLQIGRLTLRVQAIVAEKKQRSWPRPPPRRLGVSLLAATALILTLGLLTSHAPPEPIDEYGMTDNQRYLIRQYLESAAEREKAEPPPMLWTNAGREGGTGTRNNANLDPQIARAAALRDAAEFGMLGIISGGANGAPDPQDVRQGAGSGHGMPDALKTWKRSQLRPHASKLSVGDQETLPLKKMQAHVSVDGFRSRVVLDYEFENTHSVRLEGRFKLRLPNGASPYFLAFGEAITPAPNQAPAAAQAPARMNSARTNSARTNSDSRPAALMATREQTWRKPKEARMVPRIKALRAYEGTVQRNIDPALLEWAGAGVFNARVFPIEPKTRVRVVVGYDADLNASGGDMHLRFDVPQAIPEVSVTLDVADVPGTNAAVTPAAPRIRTAGRSQYTYTGQQGNAIELRLKGPGVTALSGDGYVAAAFEAALPKAHMSGSDKAVLLVDTSLSSNPDAYQVWLALMEQLLQKNRDTLKRFAVLFFNVESHWWRNEFSANTPANVAALMRHARSLALEGATDLSMALREGARAPWLPDTSEHDIFVLSDGSASCGDKSAYAISRALDGHSGAVFAYRTGLSGGDPELLAHVTREAGGAVFAVTGPAEVAGAATAHRNRPWQIVSAGIQGAEDVLLAGRPTALFVGQRVKMVGRTALAAAALAAGAGIQLVVKQPGSAPVEKTIPLAAVIPSPLAERAYGHVAVRQLEALEGAAADVARAYAMHFRVSGESASLLMLDSEADYQRHNIKPEANDQTVRARFASSAIATALRQAAAELGKPKAMFMRALSELETMPGIELTLAPPAREMITALPPAAFTVPHKPLRASRHNAARLPAPFKQQLATHDISYDDVTAMAAKHDDAAAAIRTLSSLIELNPGDAVLQRDIGYSAMQLGQPAHAFGLFHRVAAARPHEPQSYRAMGRALAAMKRADLAMAYFEIALAKAWKSRYPELSSIVTVDYVSLLQRISKGELASSNPAYVHQRLLALSQQMRSQQADLVVMIGWNTNNTDVDLHVVEPSGEECMYSHAETKSGGRLTRDITDGFGPEMYRIPHAPSGRYRIFAHYFGEATNQLSARTKVHAVVIEGYGTSRQRTHETTVTLAAAKDNHEIATIAVHNRRVSLLTN